MQNIQAVSRQSIRIEDLQRKFFEYRLRDEISNALAITSTIQTETEQRKSQNITQKSFVEISIENPSYNVIDYTIASKSSILQVDSHLPLYAIDQYSNRV